MTASLEMLLVVSLGVLLALSIYGVKPKPDTLDFFRMMSIVVASYLIAKGVVWLWWVCTSWVADLVRAVNL